MNKKTIMILGASRYYSRCIEGARAAGYKILVVDRNAESDGFRYADMSAVCDIADCDNILLLAIDNKIDGIVPINDVGVPTAAFVSERMGLRGISREVAVLATNKEAMRRRWVEVGVPCPKFVVVEQPSEFMSAIDKVGLPCILKPAHGIGGASRGVIVVEREEDIHEAIGFSQQFYADKATLVEEFVEADLEHSAEVIVHKGCAHVVAVSDKIKTPLPYRVDKAVLYPSSLQGERLRALEQVIIDSVLALGIRDGVAHVELATTPHGFVLFELGARCGGGGTANPIVKHCFGVDLFTEFVRILAGDEPESLSPIRALGCCYYFITPPPGEVAAVSGLQNVRRCEDVLDAELFIQASSQIAPVTVGTERSGFIIAIGGNSNIAFSNAVYAESLLKITYNC